MEFRVTEQDGWTRVWLAGKITEDAEIALQSLLAEIKSLPSVVFNFAGVKGINSLGVRAWVKFLRAAEENRQVWFEECTTDVVMQVNMVPSFQSKAQMLSFYTNYLCEACDISQSVLVDVRTLPPKAQPEPIRCPKCNQPMQTEELEDEYFAFLLR